MATTDSERRAVCAECGEAIDYQKVSGKVTAISRVQVLQFSKGLPGPKGDGFEMPLVLNVSANETYICFIPGQDMVVAHEEVCGRKKKR